MAQKILDDRSLSVFCSSLSMLLHAGMYMQEACAMFAQDTSGEAAEASKLVADAMLDGMTFADAAGNTGLFPDYALDVLRTAEFSGRMEEGLDRLAVYYDRADARKVQLRSTLSYPAALLLLMCGVLAVLVFFVLPMFQGVYSSLTGSIAASSYAYVLASGAIARVSLVLAVLISLGLLVAVAAMGTQKGQKWLRARLEDLPITKQAMFDLSVSSFADTLSTLLSSGMDMDGAMAMATEQTVHARLQQKLKACKTDMDQGIGLADALYNQGVFHALYGRVLVSGAAAGNLETALADLAQQIYRDSEDRLAAVMETVEPALIGFLAVSVGMTLLSVMLPLLGILGAL